MNRTEEEVVDIIEDVVKYFRDWQDVERETVYSVNHLNVINNLSSQMANLGKESNNDFDNNESEHVHSVSNNINSGTKEGLKEVLVEDERNDESLSEVLIETPREVRVEKDIVKPKLPYPQKFMRHKLDKQFVRFIDMFKQLHLSLPFTEVVTQMPNFAKFLKDILSGRRSCDVVETVNLTENCSAIIMNKMPPKLKDPGNFSIPCAINKMKINNALCDLGASVRLISFSVYQRLELGELMPSKITLQLVNRSIKIPKGKVEDVPL
ncbi:uncharacterized protein LOC110701027 [Chenopodium quinoa]|uniref:uncharacterized protein LOC110701027 n=1 Tax=Chenopodium quinoa TaxID=63459 RepID=UPI000B7810CF|nr:uncharacterized protein LOC110701027 [Chenopodium quinoa]